MSHKYKEVFAASAEVLGMVLAYMDEKEDVSEFAPTNLMIIVFAFSSTLWRLWKELLLNV